MAYCTIQNLIDEFGESEIIALTDRDRVGVVGTVVADKCIARADRLINQYLGALTLPVPIDTVTDIACDIVRYFLYTDMAPDQVTARYKDAVARLAMMQKSQLSIVTAGGIEVESGFGEAAFVSDGLVFSRSDNAFI